MKCGERDEKSKRIWWLFLLLVRGSMNIMTLAQETCQVAKPRTKKRTFLVGGNSFHVPILEYLTERIGNDFEPSINFTRDTANLYLILSKEEMEALEHLQYDFVISNAYTASCFATEQQTVALATQMHVADPMYNLSQYGSVLYTFSNRTDIQTIRDIKGKKVGTNKLSNLATHLCYDDMFRNGGHHLQDPLQTIFFNTSEDALEALLNGMVDVGCAATATLEQYGDPDTGARLDLSKIRVLHPITSAEIDGMPYPHLLSSTLVPANLVQAYPHVETEVLTRVQEELFALKDHADAAPALLACMEDQGCSPDDTVCKENCFAQLPSGTVQNCQTTPDIAIQAYQAVNASGLTGGFIEPLQNLKIRDIQENTGFLRKEDPQDPQCVRMRNMVDAVTCPSEHFARSSQDIQQQCNELELDCFSQECICNPCIKAFEVDFLVVSKEENGSDHGHTNSAGAGCSKFSICGSVEQDHVLSFRAVDNKQRKGAVITGAFLLADESELNFNFTNDNGVFYYDWHARSVTAGQKTIKIRINNEEIPESPFRIVVKKRNCAADTEDDRREPDDHGECVCMYGTVEIFDQCVLLSILVPLALLLGMLFVFIAMHFYIRHKKKQADDVWKIRPEELSFEEPPRVLGRGSFGLVLMAEYRGTKVAVKRIVPPGEDKFAVMPSAIEFKLEAAKFSAICLANSEGGEAALSATTIDAREMDDAEIDGPLAASGTVTRARTGVSTIGMRSVMPQGKGHQKSRSLSWNSHRRVFFRQRRKARARGHHIEEIRLFSRLRHPNITTVMGAVLSNKSEPMMVMEYMYFGSLYDLLHNESMFLDLRLLVGMLQDIASGLRFLHSCSPAILHGDLKSHNILVDNKFRAKLSDFGCGRLRADKGVAHKSEGCRNPTTNSPHKTSLKALGTPFWMAPELLRGDTGNTMESDVYSFGIVMYEIFSRKEPYEEDEDYHKVLQQVACSKTNKRPRRPNDCPAEAERIMNACLNSDPQLRPTAVGLDICMRWMSGSTPATESTMTKAEPSTNLGGSFSVDCTKIQVSPTSQPIQAYHEHPPSTMRMESRFNAHNQLLEAFPADIAEAIRYGREVEPRAHNDVTVVLSAIAGLDNLSKTMPENKLSDLVTRWKTCLDGICKELGVFAVETAGTAHMAVTNIENFHQDNHASLAAKFATKATLRATRIPVNEDDSSSGFLELCIGLHSGPVVSHVIGDNNPRFALIGDTINVAGHLQVSCPPGKIQCSDNAYFLLSGSVHDHASFDAMPRGIMPVKGQGDVMVYWIEPNLDQTETLNPGFAAAFFNM